MIRRRVRVGGVAQYLERIFLEEKLNNWIGYLLFTGIASVFGYLVARQTLMGLSLFGFVLGFFTVIACLLSTELGLYINLCYSFFAFHLSRFIFQDNFPVGVVTDVLLGATFLSLIIRNLGLRKNLNQFTRSTVVIGILVLVFYLLIELFNPYGHSFEGWFQTFRRFLESVFLLFISYVVFTGDAPIRRFVTVLFVLCTIAGLYGCIQQWHGLFDFERAWVTADDNRFGLFFIMGDFRKFSTMSDPTAYGVVMASCTVFFSIIAWNQKNKTHKYTLFGGILFMCLGMGYSGTRTANVMVAAGIAMFILLTLNKKSTRMFAVAATMIFLFLLYGPYINTTIIRFRTSFMGSDDESYKVRDVNRAAIRPYIHTHPIGGGLGTTGASGLRFNRGHYLAGFPPDSGYLRKALETGWVGLGLICVLYFIILKFGIRAYFRCRDDTHRLLYAACTAAIFSFYIAEFAQEAIGQITDVVVYYPLIAIMLRQYQMDRSRAGRTTAEATV